MKNIIKLLVLLFLFTGCKDVFTPEIENVRGLEEMYKEPTYAQGILGNAYILLPYQQAPESDVATDDAVTNNFDNDYLSMATGSWASNANPISQWQNRRNAIQYLNIFLANADEVEWAKDDVARSMYSDRLKGEAYGLRAIQMYYLLMAHGGWTTDGRLMGVPIVTEPQDKDSDFNVPRNTFQECLDQILNDIDLALELLPLDYRDIENAEIPEKYPELGVTNASDYNRVNGVHMEGRLSGRIVEAVRAQVALLAASPSYTDGTNLNWTDAANYAGVVLSRINGPSGLDSEGWSWYTDMSSGGLSDEVLWSSGVNQDNDLEINNFPPSLYGSGDVNPTQNLVDAFPSVNGYPITDPSATYDPANPYDNRDPRLTSYVVVNGSTMGPDDAVIVTEASGDNADALNKESGLSTRTGYYLRKLSPSGVNVNPEFYVGGDGVENYTTRIRYTEIFLAYAEAANEVWGPDGTGEQGFSAYDVVKALRERAGIGIGEDLDDPYLEDCRTNQDKMRTLIRNERRLELCFENRRFWDLRRWNVDLNKLNETALGIRIGNAGSGKDYTSIEVEPRNYQDYMYHGPIPYQEMLKWSNLEQNAGW
jgi:hypothetical protein